LEDHKEAIAVASDAKETGAEMLYRGTLGTRQCDLDQRGRTLHSKAQPLVFVYEAGPCGSWLSRYLTHKGPVCDVVAPARMPQKAGDLTPVDVPTVADDAIGDLSRAREEAIHELKAAKCRLKAFVLRHDLRDPGRAPWGPAPRRGLRAVVGPTPAPQIVFQADVRAVTAPTARLQRLAPARQDQVPRGRHSAPSPAVIPPDHS